MGWEAESLRNSSTVAQQHPCSPWAVSQSMELLLWCSQQEWPCSQSCWGAPLPSIARALPL